MGSSSSASAKARAMDRQQHQRIVAAVTEELRARDWTEEIRLAFQNLHTSNENRNELQNPRQAQQPQTQNQRSNFQYTREMGRVENERRHAEEPLMCGDDFDDFRDEPCRNGPKCWFFQRNKCKFSHEKDIPTEGKNKQKK